MAKLDLAKKLAAIKAVLKAKKAPRKVLILEDDEVSLYLMTQVVHQLSQDLVVCGVKSVDDAKIEIARLTPSLIISDCLLEAGDSGIEFWKFCQKRCPKIPFLLISGLSVSAIAKLASIKENELPRFIQKPLKTNSLQSVVKELLKIA